VIGGVQPVGKDYGAMPIAPARRKRAADGDILPEDALGSFGKTLLTAFGVDNATIDQSITVWSGRDRRARLSSRTRYLELAPKLWASMHARISAKQLGAEVGFSDTFETLRRVKRSVPAGRLE
jgi:hypothetical protein